ncbi:MerR family transcriptional regulator [Heyndrickxia sp. NPDC080065]|uniref:MerR family transcriptional regulator n=1 Tax=Heyndrickxia sp. NPDC080065 TaxID=3390568 RepID=UPI003D0797D9
MNTASAANLLGVSQRTIQRWIKQLDLDMHRNELGHFHFNEEDISVLKHIQEEIQNGILLQDIVVAPKNSRKGKALMHKKEPIVDTLLEKVNELERSLNEKADDVVSYQLLTHRSELEELKNEVTQLNMRVEFLENELKEKNNNEKIVNLNQMREKKKVKRKNIFTMLFSL